MYTQGLKNKETKLQQNGRDLAKKFQSLSSKYPNYLVPGILSDKTAKDVVETGRGFFRGYSPDTKSSAGRLLSTYSLCTVVAR